MPPRVEYDRETLVEAAVRLVRQEGWEQLSARTLAGALGCSTRPVYTAFASMQELVDAVAERVFELLHERMSEPSTGKTFVDMGIGYVAFAREEPMLFRLFLLPGLVSASRERALLGRLERRLMQVMSTTTEFGPLEPPARGRILQRLRVFTHGLACYASARNPAFRKAEVVSELVREAGRAFYLDELARASGPSRAGRAGPPRPVQRRRRRWAR